MCIRDSNDIYTDIRVNTVIFFISDFLSHILKYEDKNTSIYSSIDHFISELTNRNYQAHLLFLLAVLKIQGVAPLLSDGKFLDPETGTFSLGISHQQFNEEMAMKFFEHFLAIANSLDNMGDEDFSLWDEEDEFFYDAIASNDGTHMYLRLRTIVGLIPMFAVEVIDDEMIENLPNFKKRMKWVLDNKPELASLVSRWEVKGQDSKHLLSLLRGHRLKRLLNRMLNPDEFLSDYGVRALSKEYESNPYTLTLNETDYSVKYTPAESDSGLFGGNSNWRGPVSVSYTHLTLPTIYSV